MGAVEASVLIIVAVIGAVATLVTNIRSNRKVRDENTEQHAAGQQLLKHLSTQVNGIDKKLDTVQEWQTEHVERFHAADGGPVLRAVDNAP